MRNFTINILQFHELSKSAQLKAYNDWLQTNRDNECSELEALLAILARRRITLKNYRYGVDGYDFTLKNTIINYVPSLASISDITGVRAAKWVMQLYYRLTTTNKVWRLTGSNEKPYRIDEKLIHTTSKDSGGYVIRYELLMTKNNLFLGYKYSVTSNKTGRTNVYVKLRNTDYVKYKDDCFDRTSLGSNFALSLLESLRLNTSDSFSCYHHIKYAFDCVFKQIHQNAIYYQSMEGFVENYADKNEYLENGSIFDASQLTDVA